MFVNAGKTDLTHCFDRLVKTNYRRKPFLIAAGDRYIVFAPLTTTLYPKIYLTVVQHLLASLASTDDDYMYQQIVAGQKACSKALLNKYKGVTNLKETFSDGCVKLETEDKVIRMESLTSYIVLDEKMVVESSTKVVKRDVIGEIP